MSEQRCGTCRWWEHTRTNVSIFGGNRRWGLCVLPYPESTDLKSRSSMREQDGTDCPCYQRKESDDHHSEGTD